jgi:predicted Zn-dependent peptidase
MSPVVRCSAWIALAIAAGACGGKEVPPPVPPPPPATATAPIATAPIPLADLPATRPTVATPAPFTPPIPTVYKRDNGLTVWLVERHSLPIVSMEVVVQVGSADDPADKGGLAYQTANMVDEGAGKRGALDIARDIDRLGATLHSGAFADYSFVQLTALKKNLAPAAAILGDVLATPTFSPVEWKRVHELWTNDLKQRASEPSAVANIVAWKEVMRGFRYGHPNDGTSKSAANVGLEDVKKFWNEHWSMPHARLVVVGDITRAELDPLLDKAFAVWQPPSGWGASGSGPKVSNPTYPPRRVVVVDRPDAPQSVIALARRGIAADDADAAILGRVNGPLGGSFTSRLNQDLREEHGWSYGAKSRFTFNRYPGLFIAQAAVQTAHTGEALKAMIDDVEAYVKQGPTEEEATKSKLLARADLVEAFESVEPAAHRLGRSLALDFPPDFEAKAAVKANAATRQDLATLAAKYLDPNTAFAVVVVVGPRAKIEPQLKAIDITKIETSSPDGE